MRGFIVVAIWVGAALYVTASPGYAQGGATGYPNPTGRVGEPPVACDGLGYKVDRFERPAVQADMECQFAGARPLAGPPGRIGVTMRCDPAPPQQQ